MRDRIPWLAAIEPLTKAALAGSLFAYLLHRGGLRPTGVAAVTLTHVTAFFCLVPAPAEFVLASTVTRVDGRLVVPTAEPQEGGTGRYVMLPRNGFWASRRCATMKTNCPGHLNPRT
jgi:hypothetical protein